MSSENFDMVNSVDPKLVADAMGLENYPRERNKWRCPMCGTGGLHMYKDGWKCHSCGEIKSNLDVVLAVTQGTVSGADISKGLEVAADLFDLALEDRRRSGYVPRVVKPVKRSELEVPRASSVTLDLLGFFDLGPMAIEYLRTRGISEDVAKRNGLVSIEDESSYRKFLGRWRDQELLAESLMTIREDRPGLRKTIYELPVIIMPYGEGETIDIRFAPFDGAREVYPAKYMSLKGRQPREAFGQYTDGPLYICEGEINAMSLQQCGLEAISAVGSGTWQDDWTRKAARSSYVTIIADGDEAGEKFVTKVFESVLKMCGEVTWEKMWNVVSLPKGTDANDWLVMGCLTQLLEAGGWQELCGKFPEYMWATKLLKGMVRQTASELPNVALPEWAAPHINALEACGVPAPAIAHLRDFPHELLSAWSCIHEPWMVPHDMREMTAFMRIVKWLAPIRFKYIDRPAQNRG